MTQKKSAKKKLFVRTFTGEKQAKVGATDKAREFALSVIFKCNFQSNYMYPIPYLVVTSLSSVVNNPERCPE